MATKCLTPELFNVFIKFFRQLQKTLIKIISKFGYYLITGTLFTHLVRITPQGSPTNVNVIAITHVFIRHLGNF